MNVLLPWTIAFLSAAVAVWFAWRLSLWRSWLANISRLLEAEDGVSAKADELHVPPRHALAGFNDLISSLRKRDQRSRRLLRDESNEKAIYQHLLDAIRHGFMIVDEQLRIRFANQVIHECFPQISGLRNRHMLEVTKDHRLHELVLGTIRTGESASAELRISVASTEAGATGQRVFLAEAHPLRERPLDGAWVMLVDITDRVMTEQIRKDFVANASHELRTPLTLLQGYIETLRDGMITDREGTRRALDVMHKHSQRILRLVEDMLTVSRLESNASMLNIEPFELRECAGEVLDHLRPLIERSDVRIRLDIPDEQPPISGDRFYFEQILINLVENAIKNNPRGRLKVVISQRSDGDWQEVRVTDNGVGVPQAELPYIFKRFYRVERHHAPAVPGTGLGLSIVRRAVEAHGGTIEARSVPGIETAFVMRFPVNAEGMAMEAVSDLDPDPVPGTRIEADGSAASAPRSATLKPARARLSA